MMAPASSKSGLASLSSPPFHLLSIFVIVVLFLAMSWYMTYESVLEGVMEQLSLFMMICPLLLLVMVHWLSVVEKPTIPLPGSEPDAIHRLGSSPWGVGILLLILMFMISYQSTVQEQWFPLWNRG